MRSHQILLLVLASGCARDPLPPENPDALVVSSAPCDGLKEAACRARPDCHALYGIQPKQPAEYSHCATGPAVCYGGCNGFEPYCDGVFVEGYSGPDACAEGCVRATDCSGCRPDKMKFTQSNGCDNDGSVEFCIPPSLRAAVQSIADTLHCAPGGGRAMCDPTTQLLCQYPTVGGACASPRGALSEDAWREICQISTLQPITAIVPTIFE
jgi:hypothetical protein